MRASERASWWMLYVDNEREDVDMIHINRVGSEILSTNIEAIVSEIQNDFCNDHN